MTDQLAQAAQRYSDLGLEVFPLLPSKAPLTPRGMKDATTDPATIAQWWTEHPDALIGCRIPAGFVLIDLDPRHGGLDVWESLCAEHGDTATRTHWSGRRDGGRHLWFRLPDDHGKPSVRRLDDWAKSRGLGTQQGHRWTAGIDLLHHGHRYTILPPSPHPATGAPYRWGSTTTGPTEPIADAPHWLAELLTKPEPQPVEIARHDDWNQRAGDSIADWFSDTHTWSWLLPRHGWVLAKGDGDSDGSAWRHPAATSDVSATVRHGCLFVFSPNTPFEVTESDDPHGVTIFRAWAILEHDNDLTAAAREARRERGDPDPQEIVDRWLDSLPREQLPTVEELVSGHPQAEIDASEDADELPRHTFAIQWADRLISDPPPRAPVLVEDLIRCGEMTAMAAERNAGKTWWALNLGWSLATGTPAFGHYAVPEARRVLYLSGEADAGAVAWRLQMMNKARWNESPSDYQPPALLATTADRWRIRMVERSIRAADGWEIRERQAILDPRLPATIDAESIDVVILDPWAVFYGGSENSNDEVETALAALHEALPSSCTLIVLHHFGKSTDGRQAEDQWRGASRLADWAANRITLTFPVKADPAAGIDRHDARRWLRQTVLRRNDAAPDDLTLWRDDAGWLAQADTSAMPSQASGLSHRQFLEALDAAGGWGSMREAARSLGVSAESARKVAEELALMGAVVLREGSRGATAIEIGSL